MIIAALDLGSNTLKISVAEVIEGRPKVLGEHALITRVGEGLDKNGALLPEAMERTIAGLRDLVAFAKQHGANTIGCVGTAGLRGAKNAPEFLARVSSELGLEVEVIDGLREAELAFRAPAIAYGPGPIAVIDLGGRSTEIVTGSGKTIDARVSLEIGSVRLTERFLKSDPPSREELAALDAFFPEALREVPEVAEDATLVGVSGTIVSLIGLQLDVDTVEDAVHLGEGKPLYRDRLVEMAETLAKKRTAERIRGSVLPAGRADVIVAGAKLTLALMDHSGSDRLLASNRGVRWGLLYELAEASG